MNRRRQRPARGAGLGAAAAALAFGVLPAAFANDYQEGYRRGFEDGFAAGQRAAVQSAAPLAVPATPPPVVNRGIIIVRALYGDGRRRCEYTGPLAGIANGRVRASIDVTNGLCGDPAPGERKSLVVEYTCGGPMKQADAYEHRTLYLSCP